MLCLVAAVSSLLYRAALTAGAAACLLVLLRAEYAVVLASMAIYLTASRRRLDGALFVMAAGMLVGLVFNGLTNVLRGDGFFYGPYSSEGFTTSLFIGLHGLLLSTGKGLLFFSPAAFLGLCLLIWLSSQGDRLWGVCLSAIIPVFLMVACWWTWHGGWSWGPRLLLPLMPLLVFPWVHIFDRWRFIPAACRLATLVIILVSFAVQVRAVLSDPVGDRTHLFGSLLEGNENESIYIPHTSPLSLRAYDIPDLYWWRVLSSPASSKLIVVTIVLSLSCIAIGALRYTLSRAGMSWRGPKADLLGLSPGMVAYCAAAGLAILLFQLVPVALLYITLGSQVHPRVPGQYKFLDPGKRSGRLYGYLYAPLTGQYTFYRAGGNLTAMTVGQTQLFHARVFRPHMKYGPLSLTKGFHRVVIGPSYGGLGAYDELYWTTPGNAHYKELVPCYYLVRTDKKPLVKLAVAWTEWRWLIWLTLALAFIAGVAAKKPVAWPSGR